MPKWMFGWGEKQDEQAEVNVAELLEQVERQRAIIIEQARQIEAWSDWVDNRPKPEKIYEVKNVIR